MTDWTSHPLELYLHMPFCLRKCAYCDFLSGPWDLETQTDYVEAMKQEIAAAAEEAEGRTVSTVFVGGGTPSILETRLMREILQKLHKDFSIAPEAEITIEANPGTLLPESLREYREMGINRLSMGLQSADNGELAVLGRIHTFEKFLENYEEARRAGFDNINIDLMFALPEQTRSRWERTLRTAAQLQPEHLSAYSLIIEEGTPFAAQALNLPDEDTEYAMYEDTAAILAEYGYEQYEISNYAKHGYACRHNTGYWERTDYLGLGLGAASLWTPYYPGEEQGYMPQKRFSNTTSMREYLGHSAELSKIRKNEEVLSEKDAMAELMFLGLRKTEGVSGQDFLEQFLIPMEAVYGEIISRYERLGLLETAGDFVRLTRPGIHVSNTIMAEFLPDDE